jgi:hypothetical protein
MKIKLITNSRLCKILKVDGITLYPFIFFADENPSDTLVKHEMVHVEQIKYYGWLRFYLSYVLEYFSYRVRGDSNNVAYNKISYEIEAYKKQEIT